MDVFLFIFSITYNIFQKLEGYLLEEFPVTVPGTWFVKSSQGKNPRGALYHAYVDWKDLLRKAGLRKSEREPPKKKARTSASTNTTEEVNEALSRLEQLLEITDESLDQTKSDWKLTYINRRVELESSESPEAIFTKYPVYKSFIGREMVTNLFFLSAFMFYSYSIILYRSSLMPRHS